jgi:hypothetical protein
VEKLALPINAYRQADLAAWRHMNLKKSALRPWTPQALVSPTQMRCISRCKSRSLWTTCNPQSTGHTELDDALRTVIDLVAEFRSLCSSSGTSRRVALGSVKQQYPHSNYPEYEVFIHILLRFQREELEHPKVRTPVGRER